MTNTIRSSIRVRRMGMMRRGIISGAVWHGRKRRVDGWVIRVRFMRRHSVETLFWVFVSVVRVNKILRSNLGTRRSCVGDLKNFQDDAV